MSGESDNNLTNRPSGSEGEEGHSTPREEDDDGEEFGGVQMSIEDERIYFDQVAALKLSSMARSNQPSRRPEEEVEDELLAEESPNKNMKAMGHIGLISFSSFHARTEKSSNTNASVRSNSLASNMRHFVKNCRGKDLTNEKNISFAGDA